MHRILYLENISNRCALLWHNSIETERSLNFINYVLFFIYDYIFYVVYFKFYKLYKVFHIK